VQTGDFDRFLLRPINPLFHLLAERFSYESISSAVVGAVVLFKASSALGLAWTPLKLVYLGLAVFSGGVIFTALNLLTAASAFWLVDPFPTMRVVFDLHTFAQYPLSIYGKGIQALMTWLIPFGFASFYPASYLLERDIGVMAWVGFPLSAGLFFLAYRFWLFALGHYTGTGS
jgi:ABC-2 type transport system permease protein